MAELKRKDEELSTADLAGRSEKWRETEDRPQLARNPMREQAEYSPDSSILRGNEATAPRFANTEIHNGRRSGQP